MRSYSFKTSKTGIPFSPCNRFFLIIGFFLPSLTTDCQKFGGDVLQPGILGYNTGKRIFMIRKVLPVLLLLAAPVFSLVAQENLSLEGDLRDMAGLYAAGEYTRVRDYQDIMKTHISGNESVDPFFRDLALFLLWASRIELGDKTSVLNEMDYYFTTEGQTKFRSLPPLMSAYLYYDLLAGEGDADRARSLSDSILGIPDYKKTIRIWAEAGDSYNIVLFSSGPFLASLERRYTSLETGTVTVTGGSVEQGGYTPADTSELAAGGNFVIVREAPWYRIFWSRTFTTEKQARDTGKALIRDGVITEFIVKSETGQFRLQVAALKAEKNALAMEKELEGRSGGSR
jgi:hypothetical protein